jgi:hypothetical protein
MRMISSFSIISLLLALAVCGQLAFNSRPNREDEMAGRKKLTPKVTMRLDDQFVLPPVDQSRKALDKARKAEQSRPADSRRRSSRT